MSWSVSLGGPKKALLIELSDLILVAEKALDWVENANDESTLSLSLNGYVSWGEDKSITNASVGFQFGESTPPKPVEKIPDQSDLGPAEQGYLQVP